MDLGFGIQQTPTGEDQALIRSRPYMQEKKRLKKEKKRAKKEGKRKDGASPSSSSDPDAGDYAQVRCFAENDSCAGFVLCTPSFLRSEVAKTTEVCLEFSLVAGHEFST